MSYTALLGRVYADIFDEVDTRPLEALQGLGATRLQVLLFGILPQSRALLTSYTLYSFECAVRSAAVLGFVGAGGLGYEISLSMRLFEFPQVLTLLACFVLLLLLVDLLSRTLRARLELNPGTLARASNQRISCPAPAPSLDSRICFYRSVAVFTPCRRHYVERAAERHAPQPGPLRAVPPQP